MPTLELNQIFLKCFGFMSAILIFMLFCDVYVTSRLTNKLRDVHYNQCFKKRAGHVFIRPKISFVETGKMRSTLSGMQE